ncbi:hypothetical protein F3W84_09535 [Ochrobactrum quorumnocens]|uniref:Uncharacterized protein n=1 Tax=Ochrobactrum quorumnocens TaxID=271865 RepID=A0A5N1K5F2_9HYPH|nr:hypothetical protein F3W84_09535 [[Ochrobactrum] quorumnocens]
MPLLLSLRCVLQRFQLILNRWNRCNDLFLRISERKIGSHFCWKCFKRDGSARNASPPTKCS